MKKILVVYYSYEGHTARVAKLIQNYYQCDLLELKPIKEMTSKGFAKYFWGGAQVTMRKVPELVAYDLDFDRYDTIFIGTPIWAWTITPPVRSFLLKQNFHQKEVYLFFTHEGGPGRPERIVEKLLKDNKLMSFKGFLDPRNGQDSIENDVLNWLKKIQ